MPTVFEDVAIWKADAKRHRRDAAELDKPCGEAPPMGADCRLWAVALEEMIADASRNPFSTRCRYTWVGNVTA